MYLSQQGVSRIIAKLEKELGVARFYRRHQSLVLSEYGEQFVGAARGMMATQKLIVFKHDSELGNAPAHKLFELVRAEKKDGVTAPRVYAD